MLGKLTLVGASACGLLLIVLGVQNVLDRRAAEQVTHSFMSAVLEGDRATLLTLLAPRDRAAVGRDAFTGWESEMGVTYRIHHIEMQGRSAEAHLRIEKGVFSLKPSLHLQRSETGQWKVAGIDDLQIDPRWNDLQRARGRTEGEELARELTEALGKLPNVDVERVPFAEPQ